MIDNQEKKLFEPSAYTYPKGYFRVQVEFAKKILELGLSKNMSEALSNYTAVFRRISGKREGNNEGNLELVDDDVYRVTEEVWRLFTQNKENIYCVKEKPDDGHHVGAFVYKDSIDKETGKQKVELHFSERYRGEIGDNFSFGEVKNRGGDLKEIFQRIASRIVDDPKYRPEIVSFGSWLNNYPVIKNLLPEEFVATGENLLPPKLSFKGDSIWGQFLNSEGGINEQRYGCFLNNLAQAKNMDDLAEAFPMHVRLFKGPIEVFF